LTLDESKRPNDQVFEVRGIHFLIDRKDIHFLKDVQLVSVEDRGCSFIIADFLNIKKIK
jgi:Fe-S cluster assembly iron-binding protein IscA